MTNLFEKNIKDTTCTGYPACPEHTEKSKIWQLLDVENRIGMKLTDAYAMARRFSIGLVF